MIAIIGGGHNGMVAALTLARAGKSVTLFESHESLGGVCRKEEFHEGFYTSGVTHHITGWSSVTSRAIGLSLPTQVPASRFLPEIDGPGLLLHYDASTAAEELQKRGQSPEKYAAYRRFIASIQPLVQGVLASTPPSIQADASLFDYVPHALRFRRLGREKMLEILRIGAMSASDWVTEYATDPLLQAALCAPASFSAWLGPRSPLGTANLLFEESLGGQEIVGGAGALAEALEQAVRNTPGITTHTGQSIDEVLIENGAVTGLRTADGSIHAATAVIATCAPQHALLDLVHARHVHIDLARNVDHIRARGSVAVAHFGIKGDLAFSGRDDDALEHIVIGETTTDWERCFDHVKHRRLAPLPCLDIRIPSKHNPALCPPGHQVVSVHAFGAPHTLDGGWNQETNERFTRHIIASIERYAPGFGQQIVGSRLLNPVDLASTYRLPGGHLLHAEIAVDQLWVTRPTPALSRYTTPISGLYLGSMGMHPGAGINGISGMLAAQACLGR